MSACLTTLLSVLDLTETEEDLFAGVSLDLQASRIFGGQVVAQALVAASRTVNDKAPHSLHCYFMLPGEPAHPVTYRVERIRDGRRFATRTCTAVQNGRAIFSLSASFQFPETGFDHASPAIDVPLPEDLPDLRDLGSDPMELLSPALRAYLRRERPIELRPVNVATFSSGSGSIEKTRAIWMRADGQLPDNPAIHQAVLAYLSDMTLLDVSLAVHGRSAFDGTLQVASLDHALWFHRPFRADEWLLYVQDSPSASGARGLCRGQIFDRLGSLVASVAQEGLIRERAIQR